MKDWFYAAGSEIVLSSGNIPKSRVAIAIREGNKSIDALERCFGVPVLPEERDDVEYLIRIYGPTSYDTLSGCSGCDGCCGKTEDS